MAPRRIGAATLLKKYLKTHIASLSSLFLSISLTPAPAEHRNASANATTRAREDHTQHPDSRLVHQLAICLSMCLPRQINYVLGAPKMYLLHFIILALLGLFAPSAGAVPHHTIDATADNTFGDLSRTVGKDLAARQGYPSDLLVRYELKCAIDKKKTEFAPEAKGSFLTAAYCRTYFDCNPDGKELWGAHVRSGWISDYGYGVGSKLAKTAPEDVDPFMKHSPLRTANKEWQVNDLDILPEEVETNQLNYRCRKWCECVLVDEPKLHVAENLFVCPLPYLSFDPRKQTV